MAAATPKKKPLRYPIGSIDNYTDFLLFEELEYKKTFDKGLGGLVGGPGTGEAEKDLAQTFAGLKIKEASKSYANGNGSEHNNPSNSRKYLRQSSSYIRRG
jgi:hypothetical protein